MHSHCIRFALFINVALELHSDCTLFKRCTLCCTRCCILFAIVLHCVCTLWSIPPRQWFIAHFLHSNWICLHSLINSPGRHYWLCSLFQSYCTIVLLFGKFRRGHYLLHSNCTRIALFIALDLHSNCNRIALFVHSCCSLWSIPRRHYWLHYL